MVSVLIKTLIFAQGGLVLVYFFMKFRGLRTGTDLLYGHLKAAAHGQSKWMSSISVKYIVQFLLKSAVHSQHSLVNLLAYTNVDTYTLTVTKPFPVSFFQ